MKSILAIIAFAATILTVRAADSAPPPVVVVPGSNGPGGGDYTLLLSNGLPSNVSLIKSGRRGTVRYFGRNTFTWPISEIDLDLNVDGSPDFTCAGGAVTTLSIPDEFWWWFDLQCGDSSQVLTASNSVAMLPFDALISSNSAGIPSRPGLENYSPGIGPGRGNYSGPSWSESSNAVNVTTAHSNPENFWTGPLGQAGIGYMGVRFQAADGWHYGWIRVCLPMATMPLSFQPLVLDWAYEQRPNKPIRAGAVSSARDAKVLGIGFRNPDGSLHFDEHGHVSHGAARLIGQTLRYELHMAGTFSNATFFSDVPGVQFGQRRLASTNLDSPRIDIHLPCDAQQDTNGLGSFTNCQGDLTVFFGDIKLNGVQLELLRRGKLKIDVGNGAVIGSFSKYLDEIVVIIEVPRLPPGSSPGLLPPTTILTPLSGVSSSGVEMRWHSGDPSSAAKYLQQLNTTPPERVAESPPLQLPANP